MFYCLLLQPSPLLAFTGFSSLVLTKMHWSRLCILYGWLSGGTSLCKSTLLLPWMQNTQHFRTLIHLTGSLQSGLLKTTKQRCCALCYLLEVHCITCDTNLLLCQGILLKFQPMLKVSSGICLWLFLYSWCFVFRPRVPFLTCDTPIFLLIRKFSKSKAF